MKNKCDKYESLYIFGDEKSLEEHIEKCPECKEEHEKMQKISALIKEAAPYIKKRKKHNLIIQSICATFLLFVMLGSGGIYHKQNELLSSNYYENDVSFISEYGFPTDEYGLLLVE